MKNKLATFLLLTAGILLPSFAQDSLEQLLPDSSSGVLQDQSNVASVQESAEVSENPASLPLQSAVKSPDVKQNEKLLSVNIFQISNRIANKFENGFKNSRKEIGSLSARLKTVKESLGPDEYRQRVISLLVILAFSIGIAILSGFLVWRAGSHFKSLSGKQPGNTGRFAGAGYIFLNSISLWVSLAAAGLCFEVIHWGPAASSFLLSAVAAMGIYGITVALIQVLWAPRHPQLRLIPWSDPTSTDFVRKVSRILRYSLFLYMLYSLSEALGWQVIAFAFSGIYKITLTILIPRFIYKFRDRYSRYVTGFIKQHGLLPGKISLVTESVLSKLYIVVFLLMASLSGASLLGYSELYSYLLASSIKTLILIPAVIVAISAWGFIFRGAASFISSNPYLGFQNEKNRRILEKGGHGLVLLSGAFVFVNTWGVNLLSLFRTDIPLIRAVFHISAIALIAFIAVQVLNILVIRFQKEAASRMVTSHKSSPMEVEKRVSTLGGIIKKISLVSILVIAVMMIMDELGFDIKALLAGVGIVGLAVGFGAQNLVRDVISGLFVIFENRIRVGDVAIINGTGGQVEQVNLRTSVLRGLDGTIHVFPNGGITSLSNMTHEYSYYLFNIGVAYKEDTDRVISLVEEIGKEIMQEEPYKEAVLEPLEVLGVDSFADSAVIIKARIKTLPIKQWMVGREMNRRIKKRFDEEGIEIPFPHRSLYFGESSKPVSFKLEGATTSKEDIREIVREVLMEQENRIK